MMADAVKESGEDVEGDLEIVGIPGDDEAVVRVETSKQSSHVFHPHPVFRLKNPGPLSHDGVDHQVEDDRRERAALGDAAASPEAPTVVAARPTDQLFVPPEPYMDTLL